MPILSLYLQVNPFVWVWRFATDDVGRILLVFYWVVALVVMIGALALAGESVPCIIARKFFHALLLAIAFPALFFTQVGGLVDG